MVAHLTPPVAGRAHPLQPSSSPARWPLQCAANNGPAMCLDRLMDGGLSAALMSPRAAARTDRNHC